MMPHAPPLAWLGRALGLALGLGLAACPGPVLEHAPGSPCRVTQDCWAELDEFRELTCVRTRAVHEEGDEEGDVEGVCVSAGADCANPQVGDLVFTGDVTDPEIEGGGCVVGQVKVSGPLVLDSLALAPLRRLEGDLILEYTGLQHLGGLQDLGMVSGSLRLEGGSALLTLSGLDNLAFVGADLEVLSVPNLADLALPALRLVVGDLVVADTPSLPDGEVERLFREVEVGGEARTSVAP